MNATSNLRKLALALLFATVLGASSSLHAQRAQGKPAAPVAAPAAPPQQPLAVKAVEDKLAPAGWVRYEIGQPSRFSLILPAAPQESMNQLDMTPGVTLTVRNYMVGSETGVYGATYIVGFSASNSWTDANKKTFFEGFAKGFVRGFQEGMSKQGVTDELKVLAQRTATASGFAGHEQDFAFGAILGRVRMVFAGQSAYAVAAFWNERASESDRKAFFESLRVNTKR